MATPRVSGDRFEAAKAAANNTINTLSGVDQSLLVTVYTFNSSSINGSSVTPIPAKKVHGIEGFIGFSKAQDELEALTTTDDVGGSTPLAGAMCAVIDILKDTHTNFPTDTLFLQVNSDGEENTTPLLNECHGDVFTETVTDPSQYPSTSYQAKVLLHLANSNTPITAVGSLFESSPFKLAAGAPGAPDPEGILSPQARSLVTAASISTGLNSFEQFLTFFTQATGGHLTIIHDDEPLPVPGDLSGDRCVDRADAILVARAFGPLIPPVDGQFDLNFDRTVDFTDYQIQLSHITSTCGPDPYVARAPLVCKDASRIVIDDQSIEDGGTTIDARGACEITIRNSLIVSGQNAITIVGRAKITVDNSIIVGQNAVIVQHGGGVLSAGNTIFHGKTAFKGSLQFVDRGGNVFE